MILVLAGTKDGRQLASQLAKAGYHTIVSVVSQYGKELAEKNNLVVYSDPLDKNGMIKFIEEYKVKLVVDASHPYAVNVSKNAMQACEILQINYIRYERPTSAFPHYNKLYLVTNYQEAALKAADLGKTIFLSTGSRALEVFKREQKLSGSRIIARILPDPEAIAKCFDLGFNLRDIIALQGPFSHELNVIMFKDYGADVVIMKNSGQIGGSDTKISAAIELSLPLVVIDRPAVNYRNILFDYNDVLMKVKEVFK